MTTEAQAVAELATKAATVHTLMEGDGWKTVAHPVGTMLSVVDQTQRNPMPERSKGTILVHDGPSFVAAVKRRVEPSAGLTVPVYIDDEHQSLTAVLNDDAGLVQGWRDYRVKLSLRRTPEWSVWRGGHDRYQSQKEFADLIEERVAQIVSPAGAVMLDLAQSIEGSVNAQFRSGQRLQSGARQVMWTEEVQAKGGTSGNIEIPDRFTFAVPLFFAGAPVEITALLRFRINGGHLLLGYAINDLERIELEAFTSVVNEVVGDDIFFALRGPAPEVA